MKYIIKPIINHPFITVLAVSAITVFLGFNILTLRVDNDMRTMLPNKHNTKIVQDAIEEDFGASEMLMIGLETDTIFKPEFLSKVKTLSKKLQKLKIQSDPFKDQETGEIRTKKKKCIANVNSLSTINHIEGSKEGMSVSALMKNVPQNTQEMNLLKEKIFSWDFYIGNLVSSDGTAILIAVKYKRSLSPAEMVKATDAIQAVVQETGFNKDVNVYIAGHPFVEAIMSKHMMKDLSLMIPIVFSVIIVFLLFTMRNISNVVLIFVTIGVSVVWTMGIMALFGFTMNITTSSVPVLLVAIGSAYSIHILNHYSEERGKGKSASEAVEKSITIVGVSVFGAGLTTMVGFMSLMTSSIVPISEFGLFTGIGTGVALFVSIVFVPALLLVLDRILKRLPGKRKINGVRSINLAPYLLNLYYSLIKRQKMLISLVVIVVAAACFFSLQLYPDLHLVGVFKENSEVKKADRFLCSKFNGTTTTVIAFEAGDDYFKEPAVLRKLDRFKTDMEKDPRVGMVLSIAEPIKRMNFAMHGNQKEYDCIPETREHIAQYLFLNSDPEALEEMVTTDFSKARVLILLKIGSTATLNEFNKKIRDWLDREMPDVKWSIAGTSQLALAMNELIVTGQIKSLIFSIAAVFFISTIILRSFIAGLLAIMPLGISIILNFGVLGLFRIPLDVGTATISCVAIGIAVDYSIHLLNGIRYGLLTKGPEGCIDEGLKITGNAITFNALSVALGFMVLAFSSFTNLIKFGSFISFTMATACLGTLILLPVLVNIVGPKRLLNSNTEYFNRNNRVNDLPFHDGKKAFSDYKN